MIVLAAAAFFASGFAALLYQVIWQRLLVIFSGADLYSVTIIVAAFMGGLGAGNLAGGHIADKTSPRTGLLLFAGAELAIAVFGFFSAAFYYGFLYRTLGQAVIPAAAMAGILFLSLLWPTFFMGASLPLLARALADRIEKAASIIGVLYGVNTLGAAAGAILATWVLIPRFGLDGSLRVGVALNVACAVLLLPAAFLSRRSALGRHGSQDARVAETAESGETSAPADASRDLDREFGFNTWAAAFALSGMLALSLEIAWFRLLAVMMKSTTFTFGTLLGLYLTGIGVGSLVGSAIAPRLRKPGAVFLGLQAAVGFVAMFLLTAFVRRVDNSPLWPFLGSYEPIDVRGSIAWLGDVVSGAGSAGTGAPVPWAFLAFYIAVPAALILPPTLLMGCSFPVLQRVVQTRLALIGRRVGLLLLANVLGSMVGTVVTGWLLVDWLGTAGTMRLLAAISGVFAMFAVWRAGWPPVAVTRRAPLRAVLIAAAVFVPLVGIMPSADTLWAHMHGTVAEAILFAEGASGLSVIRTDSRRAVVLVNGMSESTMPYGDVHTALGALPAFVHPAPRTALVIGLGSGDTVHAVAGRRDIGQITCIEIIREQLETLRALTHRLSYGGLASLLSDPRIQQVFGDGRIYLKRGNRQFDIIEADALRPTSAYSGNVYSDAYFALVREHLTPTGVAATWAPTQRVYNTFIRSFPYVVSVAPILLGSQQPIAIDREAIARRLADPWTQQHFMKAEIDIGQLIAGLLQQPIVYGPDFPRDTLTDINTDLFPRDEFDLSRRPK